MRDFPSLDSPRLRSVGRRAALLRILQGASLDGIVWTVTPTNKEREEYKITASVSDLVKMLRQSYGFLTCVGWNTIDIRVGCSDVYLYGYFAQN